MNKKLKTQIAMVSNDETGIMTGDEEVSSRTWQRDVLKSFNRIGYDLAKHRNDTHPSVGNETESSGQSICLEGSSEPIWTTKNLW